MKKLHDVIENFQENMVNISQLKHMLNFQHNCQYAECQ